MSQEEFEWDLFISYARNDKDWLRRELLEPLRGYRNAQGRPVKAFVDTEELHAGFSWMEEVMTAITKSRVLIALYSKHYFESDFCRYELIQGLNRDPVGRRGMFRPLAISADAGELVPQPYKSFTWLETSEEGWFKRLIDALGFRHHGRILHLEFMHSIPSGTAGVALENVRVEIRCDGVPVNQDETVRLLSENGTLRGTTAVKTERGLALFDDVFFDAPVESTRLVAIADGCPAVYSDPLSIRTAPAIVTHREDPRIGVTGDVFFFGEPEVIGIACNTVLHLFSLTGQAEKEVAIPSNVRLAKPAMNGLALCDWDGRIVWIGPDGKSLEWTPGTGKLLNVVGDLTSTGAKIVAGMWSGDIWSLERSGFNAHLNHPGGIQCIESSGDNLFVADLDGWFAAYTGTTRSVYIKTEHTIRRLLVHNESVVLIGEERVHQYSLERRRIFSLSLPLGFRINAVYGIGETTVAVSAEGQCVVLRGEAIVGSFWTLAGSIPISMDQAGKLIVFSTPDQGHSLWHNRRPVLQGVDGGMAVSRDGTLVAIGHAGETKISKMGSLVASAAGGTSA